MSCGGPQLSRSTFLASLVAIPAAAAAEMIGADGRTTTSNNNNDQQQQEQQVLTAARQESISGFVAGAALAATKTLVKYPLDTATVRLQMPQSPYSLRQPFSLFDNSYRGVGAPLLANIPAGAVFFAVKDVVKAYLNQVDPDASRWTQTAIAVGVALVPYWMVRNPSEVVKTRQQAGIDGYDDPQAGMWQAYRQVYNSSSRRRTTIQQMASSGTITTPSRPWTARAAGLDAFYTGYWENILYAYPADVIKFVVYEQLTGGRKNLPPAQGALAGAAATAVAQLVTTPLDVIRNRIMAETNDDSNSEINDDNPRPSSSLSYTERLVQLARDEGLPGLFAGVTPRVGKALLSGAIQFATYEETKLEMAKLWQRQQQ